MAPIEAQPAGSPGAPEERVDPELLVAGLAEELRAAEERGRVLEEYTFACVHNLNASLTAIHGYAMLAEPGDEHAADD